MTLRLDPAVPLVWRTTTTLQLGGLHPLAVFPDVSHDDELLLAALRRGTTRAGLQAIADVRRMPSGAAEGMLERVRDGLVPEHRRPDAAVVVGEGRFAELLDAALRSDGRDPVPGRVRLAVLVAPWLVLPADAAVWLRRDVPHLPIVLGDRTVTVGPLVRPGETPCLHCLELARIDADPAWPAVAGQLLALPAPEPGALATAHALSLAARTVLRALGGEEPSGRQTVLDTVTGSVGERTWSRHPECRCAAPPGSGWAPAGDPAPGRIASGTSAAPGGSARA